MPYLNRQTSRKHSGSPELMYLLVVLAAGVATAYWAGHQIGMDLSAITSLASMLGLTEAGRSPHAAVGYNVNAPAAESPANQPAAAPYCSPGQAPAFAPGLSGLRQHLGDTMGVPLECAHPASASGDTMQQTSAGLAYTNSTNTVYSFTDGWRHWAITQSGFVQWEGPESAPPAGG